MARSPSEEPKPTIADADGQADNQADELKRLDTILRISTELKSRELREKFKQIVIDGWRARDRAKTQHAKLLEEKKAADDAVDKAERELEGLRNEIVKWRRDFGESERQMSDLRRQLLEHTGGEPLATPRKRRKPRSPDCKVRNSSSSEFEQ